MGKNQEKEITILMEKLELTREEAMEILEFDKGNIDNEEAEELEEKVKTQTKEEKKPKDGKKGKSSLDKIKYQKAQKKVDVTKAAIMDLITSTLSTSELIQLFQKMAATKSSFMDKDGNYYSVSLTKHKTKPDGFQELEEK